MPRAVPLSDDARYPGIPADRRDLLHRLRQHAHAPAWNLACGDRLDAAATAALGRWDASLRAGPPLWREGETPAWLGPWVERTVVSVPFYRERTSPGAVFSEIPTFRRKDLAHAPWAFVPEDHPLDDLLIYPTSGTTGPAFDVYSHPVASNAILPFLRFA